MGEHNKQLLETAGQSGVETTFDFALFQTHGYKGLYRGLDAEGIHESKGLETKQEILDHIGRTELAANLFRATQTEDKLRREQINRKTKGNQTHYEVGKKTSQIIQELGGSVPADYKGKKRQYVHIRGRKHLPGRDRKGSLRSPWNHPSDGCAPPGP